MARLDDEEKVKVLGFWVSPFSRRVEWALKLKGIEYEYIEEDVIFNKSPLLLSLNPVHKKVPVLVHNDHKVVSESYVILEYIDETWNNTSPLLLPSDPFERAIARFWAKFAEEKIHVGAFKALICSLGEEKEKGLRETMEAMEHIEGEMKKINNNFFGGESIGYLDIALGWMAYWLPVFEEVGSTKLLDPHKFPAMAAWGHRFITHPLIEENLPPRDKMVVYFQQRKQALTSLVHG